MIKLLVQVCAGLTHFGKNLHDVTEDLHSPVYGGIRSQEESVVESLKGDFSL